VSDTADSTPTAEPLDLDVIERDLAGVETALQRLDAGTYWTDEVTGAPIDDAVLVTDPTTRRAAEA
jgi:RNA polymerase-binding transcription factor DksA